MTIPNSVTEIGNEAFYGCGLNEVKLLDGDEAIELGSDVFKNVYSLKSLYIGRPLERQIFPGSNLRTLILGNTIKEIGSDIWNNIGTLTSLTLGSSLNSIGENAFSGCTALTEVVVPPSVETIGAPAFAGNSNLASIIMGHNVKTIGEKAFDGCKASTVSITAQTPPTAPNNTFCNYTGKLYLQGKAAIDAYYDAFTCWDRFDSYVMIEPTQMKYDGKTNLNGKPGDTFQLTATLMPENVTLPQIFWCSTNPAVATVDANGLVTLCADLAEVLTRAEGDASNSCQIIAESLYANGPVLTFNVTSDSAEVEETMTDSVSTEIDFNQPVEVYNLNGFKVATSIENLDRGIYIVREGNAVKKIAVK